MAVHPATPDTAAARIGQAARALSQLPRDDLETLLLACARSFAGLARIAGVPGPEAVPSPGKPATENLAALTSEEMVALLAPMAVVGSLAPIEHGQGRNRVRRVWNVARF